jgi:mono/diheme cytochrome c family protein
MRKNLTLLAVALLVLALGASVAAQSPPPPKAPPAVVVVNAHDFGAIEGARLYQAYCASCHGWDGKGNGPAARSMPAPVPDLTQLAATHTDTDCFRHVLAQLQEGHRPPNEPKMSEKDLDMPNWGPIFKSMSSDPGIGYLRLRNVSQYVTTIQTKK